MHAFTHLDQTQHGTPEFPAEYYFVDSQHPRYQMPFHWHNEWEILRVLDGSFQLHIDNEQYDVRKGDILLIRGGVLHGGIPSNCIYECFVFNLHGLFRSTETVKKSLRPFYRQQLLAQCYFPSGSNEEISQLVDELLCAFSKTKDFECKELITIGSMCRLFTKIIQKGLYREAEQNNYSNNNRMEQLKSVLEYIETNYGSNLTLENISSIAGMSPKYFCKFFHSLTHQSPMEYVNFYRIEQSAFMLESTDASITVIASECGFAESSYFTKVFRKYKGITPREYRRSTAAN